MTCFLVFVCEIIIRQIGGKWLIKEEDDISSLTVSIKSEGDMNLELKPLFRIANYIDDRENSIDGWYHLIKSYCNGQINVDNLEYNKWYNNADKGRFRIISAK